MTSIQQIYKYFFDIIHNITSKNTIVSTTENNIDQINIVDCQFDHINNNYDQFIIIDKY